MPITILGTALAERLLAIFARDLSMQISSTFGASSYAAASRSQNPVTASTSALTTTSDGSSGSGVSSYDFSSMSPTQLRVAVNDLIKSGKMTLDESTSLVPMMAPGALRWAGSGTPSPEQLGQMDNTPINLFAHLQAGLAGAQSRGETQNAQYIDKALDALNRFQGAISSVDIRA